MKILSRFLKMNLFQLLGSLTQTLGFLFHKNFFHAIVLNGPSKFRSHHLENSLIVHLSEATSCNLK